MGRASARLERAVQGRIQKSQMYLRDCLGNGRARDATRDSGRSRRCRKPTKSVSNQSNRLKYLGIDALASMNDADVRLCGRTKHRRRRRSVSSAIYVV